MCLLWVVLLECCLLLQLSFNIVFIPSAPLSWPPATQQISEKHLCFSQPTSCLEEQVFQVRQGHLPEYTVNTTPGIGLQVKFCPLGVGSRLSICSWDCHDSITLSRSSVAATVGDTAPTLVYLWSGLAHRHTGFAPGKLLLCICGEEQNSQSFSHCHWREMHARTLFLTLVFGERKESPLHCYCRSEKKIEFVMLVLWSWYYPWNEQPVKTQGPVGCFHFSGKLWQSSVSLMGSCLLTKATEMSGFPGHCKTQTIGDCLLPAAWNFFQCQEPSTFSSDAEDFLCYLHAQFLQAFRSPLPGTQTPLAHTVPWACPPFWAMNDHCYFSSFTVKRSYLLHKALRRNIIFFSCQRKCDILHILNECLRGSFTALL